MKNEKIQDLIKQLKRHKQGCQERIIELDKEYQKSCKDEYITGYHHGRKSTEEDSIEKLDTYLSYLEV